MYLQLNAMKNARKDLISNGYVFSEFLRVGLNYVNGKFEAKFLVLKCL